ncbi:UNVERIFIED_ORG: phenylpropionate dioxygenase-like ring-hydroxylating dioxygenase large terminal subunit [Peribacillus simplex]
MSVTVHGCMKSIRLEVQNAMIFVNLDKNAPSLAEAYQEFLEEMKEYPFFDSLKLVRETRRVVKANWKAVVDNYLECDHCSIAHPGLQNLLIYRTFAQRHTTNLPINICQQVRMLKVTKRVFIGFGPI